MSLLRRVAEMLSGSAMTAQKVSVLRFGNYKLTDTALIFPEEDGRRPLRFSEIENVLAFPEESPPVQVTCKDDQFCIDVGPQFVDFMDAITKRAPWVMVGLHRPDTKSLHMWGGCED